MTELLNYAGVGGFALVFLSVFFEISKIPLNPISWLGQLLNKSVIEKVDKIEHKLDDHIVKSYRNDILRFQEKLLIDNKVYAREEWNNIITTCTAYEEYITANKIPNGQVIEAMTYIRAMYQDALKHKTFKDIPKGGNEDERQAV